MSPKRDRTSEGDPQKGTPAHPDKTEAEAAESAEAAGREQAAEEQAAAGGRGPTPGAQADADAAEEKPKRARRARAKAEKRAEGEDISAEEEAAAAGDGEDEAEAEDEDEEAPQPSRRRRGAPETTTGASRRTRRSPDGDVTVRAKARYVRTAPRKARLVVEHIRGKPVDEARAILAATPRAASRDVLKLLESCVANAENNHELDPEELKVGQAFVDEGPTIKRYRPRALGRATRINKRTSHMTITLVPK